MTDSPQQQAPALHQSLAGFGAARYSGTDSLDGLESVLTAIAEGARRLESQIRGAALVGVLGSTGETNVQGEIVQRLDAASSDTFVEVLSESGRVAIVGCEEIEAPVIVGDSPEHGYMVLMDPLDGSSNIDVAVSIGSIFGIWKRDPNAPVTPDSLLRPGNEQVAAAYVVYGSSTVLTVATEGRVDGFTLEPTGGDRAGGEFRLTSSDMNIPAKAPYYSVNDGNTARWEPGIVKAVDDLRPGRSQRYIGSLVADFHRNLRKGGIFLYTADSKNVDGRLRLMYEANPLGYIAEQAGGAVSDGKMRVLDIVPDRLHQRTPLIVGDRALVEQSVATIQGA
jgi:fructose-1,6-bisphosphatase I